MRRSMLCLTALVLLAGCDGGAPADPAPKREIIVRSPEQKRLFALDEANRLIGLKRAIYASGSKCPRLTEAAYIGRYKNMDMWGARCSDGRDWALFIGADDSVQLRLCKDTEAVGLPPCRFGAAAKPD